MKSDEIDESKDSTHIGPLAARVRTPRTGAFRSALSVEPAYSVVDRLRHLHTAPLNNLRHSLWWVRKTFFTKPRSVTAAYIVDLTKPEIVGLFGRNYFEPGWELSYNYLGEVLNLRRVEYVDDGPHDWWQVHIRGYPHRDGGIELTAHFETDPSEHPDAHVRLYGLDVDYGMEVIRTILEDEGVDYRYLDPTDLSVGSGQNTANGFV